MYFFLKLSKKFVQRKSIYHNSGENFKEAVEAVMDIFWPILNLLVVPEQKFDKINNLAFY